MKPRKSLPRPSKPLKRGPAPKRKTRPKAKRATPRKSGRVLNPAYLASVRTMPCYACGRPGPSDPDHMGPHPLGRKADDDTAVPLDRACHERRQAGFIPTSLRPFPGWVFVGGSSMQMKAWCAEAIDATRSHLGYVPQEVP